MDCSQALIGTNGTSLLQDLKMPQGNHYPAIPYVSPA